MHKNRPIGFKKHLIRLPEIVPVRVISTDSNLADFNADETPRVTTLEKMAALKPAFIPDGIITAGNSSPIKYGASLC
ncbi:3-ketoacyl-CoA thiolase [Brevibacillus laterosporus]|nr:3-ketoacyl-CoA thiolase [Brevibacillus laterosporus]